MTLPPIRIERIGADGDGVGRLPDGVPVYVPFAVPGDVVAPGPDRAHGNGRLAAAESWIERGPDRADPICPVFGACGGCALQHLSDDAYRAWKTDLLRGALARAGFPDAPVESLKAGSYGARRRMDLGVRRTKSGVVVGLHRMRAAEIVDLPGCPVLRPELEALIAPLRDLFASLRAPWREASAIANLLDTGPDLAIRADADPAPEDRAALAAFAGAHGIPRISWARGTARPEPAAQLRPPVVAFSGVAVAPPPAAFLQATAEGEAAIRDAVLDALPARLPTKARIAELYAGCGTLTFALAGRARVSAWEGDAAAVEALSRAANAAGLAGRVTAARRDLARQPLQPKELAGFAAVVLDPPHGGAAAQMPPLAASGVKLVVYVGCDPAGLARDVRVLAQAAFRPLRAVPIDQFHRSPRLESVVVLAR